MKNSDPTLTALIAVRAGSKRVPRKNVRPFSSSTMLEIKIQQALRIDEIDEVVVTSDDDEMLAVAKSLGATPSKRAEYYTTDTVPMSDVYVHLASSLKSDDIIWIPVTSPLVKDKTIRECIEIYRDGDRYDSVVTAHIVKEYLWMNESPINYDAHAHPRSQDLPDIYALNFAVNILPRRLMIEKGNILGNKFFPYMLDEVESIDVDTEHDFMLAEILYNRQMKKEIK